VIAMDDRNNKLKLVAFDLDGTLTVETSSWQRVHRFFGTEAYGAEGLRDYELGRIGYEEFMRRDIAYWPKGLNIKTIEEILLTFSLRPEAEDTIRQLRQRGMRVVVITSGLAPLARNVCKRLQIEDFAANDLETDAEGRLTGQGILVVEPLKKDRVLHEFLRGLNLRSGQALAVGDTKFDRSLLRAAGIGVAFKEDGRPDPELLEVATYIITKLTDIISIVDHVNL
jgi:phosphoserine phosphatase